MNSRALAPIENAMAQTFSLDDTLRLGDVLARSGFFKDAKEAAQCVTKILAGHEIGIGPVAAMVGIHVVDGKPTFSARLMASLIKRSGRYTYRVKTMTEQECTIEFFEDKESIGVSTFTMKDAATAGLNGKPVWKAYPRNMLFARAMSNGFNWYTPDLSNGLPVYTPEEMGAEVDADGDIVQHKAQITVMTDANGEIIREPVDAEMVDPEDLPFDQSEAQPEPVNNKTMADGLTFAIQAGVGQDGYKAYIKETYSLDSPRQMTEIQGTQVRSHFAQLAKAAKG